MLRNLTIGFIFIINPEFAYANKIDYCKTIEFSAGVFNKMEIQKSSEKDGCREKPVPIFYNGIKDYFYLSKEAYPPGGISYITWDGAKNKYGYDPKELNTTIDNIIKENTSLSYLNSLKYHVNIETSPRKNGALVISDVIFLDKKDAPISLIKTLFFYSQDNYAATYYSGPVQYSDAKRIDYLIKVTDLFNTMEINW
ncbi:MAG: hypothetical protein ACTH8P_14575 [Ewingella sp.]|uniref:hypothetical protein n=1 Tax=Ewingella TaxID=41201 RepID=UPI00336550DD